MNFKKAISLIVAAAMSAMLLTSCGKTESDVPEDMQLVATEFTNYKFFVPTDWIPDTSKGGFVSAKTSDNSNVSMQAMTWDTRYSSLDEYFRADYFAKVSSTFKVATLLEEECSVENQTVGTEKHTAAKYVYTVESDGTVYKIMQYFTYNAGYLYIITYTAQEAFFTEHLEEVSSIVENIVL